MEAPLKYPVKQEASYRVQSRWRSPESVRALLFRMPELEVLPVPLQNPRCRYWVAYPGYLSGGPIAWDLSNWRPGVPCSLMVSSILPAATPLVKLFDKELLPVITVLLLPDFGGYLRPGDWLLEVVPSRPSNGPSRLVQLHLEVPFRLHHQPQPLCWREPQVGVLYAVLTLFEYYRFQFSGHAVI